MKNLIADIKNKTFKKVYLITGSEIFLEEYYLNDLIKSVTDNSADDFNTMTVSREAIDIMNVASFIDSYPLMSERKILVIKNTGILKKANDEEKKFFVKALENVADFTVIVFYENEIDKRNAIYKQIVKSGYIAEFPMQKGSALTSWVSKIVKASQKQMDLDTIEYFISACNPGMINIKCELDKLLSYKKENPLITKQDVDTLVTKSVESKVFEMAEDIVSGNCKDAQKKLEDIKKLGTKPVEILPAIFSKFVSYKKTKLLSHLPVGVIAEKTKSRDFFVRKDLSTIKNVSKNQIDKVIKLCQNADYLIKSGQSDGWAEISMIIICFKIDR